MAKTKKKARKTKKKAKKKSPRKPAARRTFLASGGEVLSRPDWSRTAGTSEQGQIRYSYNELKKILGPPTFLAERDEMGQEQSAEWQIQFPDGTFVMIYDYKQSPLYEPDMYGLDPEVEEVPASVMKKYRREKIDWSVNGKSPAAMAWVQYALGKRKSSPSAAKVVAGKAAGKRGGYMGELWRAFRGIDNPETKKWLSKAITRKGKLGGAGFLSKPVDTQKKILDRCVAQYGYRSCLGSVMVLERIPKTEAKYGSRLKTLRTWMVKTYGGPGSFGPRSNPDAGLDRADVREMVRQLEQDAKALIKCRDWDRAADALDQAWLYAADAGLGKRDYAFMRKLAEKLPSRVKTRVPREEHSWRTWWAKVRHGQAESNPGHFTLVPEITDCPACRVKTNPDFEAALRSGSHRPKRSSSGRKTKKNPNGKTALRALMRGT